MKKFNQGLQLVLAVVMLLVIATGAQAALRDFGPINPLGGFPSWYRDNNGVALQQCLSRSVSPVPNAATGLPICNILPNPDSIPPFDATQTITFFPNPATNWNYPDESFYYSLGPDPNAFAFAAGKGRVVIVLALEAAFGTGNPVPGDQVVFSRVRVFLTQGVPNGNYKITHPYGVENLTVTGGLLRFTRDLGLVGPAFTGPLAGDMGPYFTWTPDAALIAAGAQNADGTLNGLDPVSRTANGTVFLGDPNVPHTFQGSPFGTNYFRVDGPVGSGIGGPGVDFIESNLGLLEGWKYTTPIPSPLTIDRLTYRRDAISGQIDVFATTSALSNQGTPSSLTITGTNIIPAAGVVMEKDAATGTYFAHISNIPPALFPTQITITNTADNQPIPVVGDLVDEVFISEATYEPVSKTLTVKAASGDLLNNPAPALTADHYGPIPANGTLVVAGVNAPPSNIRVVSAAHGSSTKQLLVRAFVPPVAGNDTAGVLNINPSASSVVIDVLANDSATAPATLVPATVVAGVATNGTTSVNPATGAITYTLNPAFVGSGSDAFTYTVTDSNGVVSLAATVTVTITSANIAPVANNDAASGSTTGAFNIAVLANDTSATSTLNPDSIVIVTQPAAPAVVTPLINGTGNVSFSSATAGIYSFQYTVNDTFGIPATSNVATAVVTITAPAVPPAAVNDSAVVTAGSSVVINVAANDTAGTNPISASSVTVAGAPANGTVLANAGGAGTITYTPNTGFAGADSFTYTIKDTLGNVSGNATVSVTVNAPTAETITITRAQFTLSGALWRIEGNTTARVAGQTMKIFNSATVPADTTTGLLATVTVNSADGKFIWSSPSGSPAPNALRRISILSSLNPNNNKREQVTVTVR